MACKYVCDGCGSEVEAQRSGMYQLVPAGWYVVADGPLGKRGYEFYACKSECLNAAALRLPAFRRDYVSIKQILRGKEASARKPLACDLCVNLGGKCAIHGSAS